jgi:hypothetical protein
MRFQPSGASSILSCERDGHLQPTARATPDAVCLYAQFDVTATDIEIPQFPPPPRMPFRDCDTAAGVLFPALFHRQFL